MDSHYLYFINKCQGSVREERSWFIIKHYFADYHERFTKGKLKLGKLTI